MEVRLVVAFRHHDAAELEVYEIENLIVHPMTKE
jgi:hypothetical protein